MELHRTQSEQLSSSQRPVPLVARADLVIEPIQYGDTLYTVIKDPIGLKYYRLQSQQYAVLSRLDGQRSLVDLRDALQQQFPATHITAADVQSLIADLHEKGLVLSQRFQQGETLFRRAREQRLKRLRQTLLTPLYIRLPGWDPDRFLTAILSWFRWIFRPWAVVLFLGIDVASLVFLAMRFDDILARLPEFQQFFGWPNLILLWGTMGVVKVIHEFGHGLSCKYFGAECHSMGVMLLVFSPTLYCDVTDSWMLRNKWKRIAIAAGGMYIEVFIAACAIFLWWNTQPGLINHLCLNVFFISTVTTVIFNANPLMRYDGYYMLADFLEVPNLRQKATRLFQDAFSKHCLGGELPPDPFMPDRNRGWFVLYAIATTIYQYVILFGITLFLYSVLKPYRLQSIGITVAVVSLVMAAGSLLWGLYKLISMPRPEPLSRPRVIGTLTAVAALIAVVVFIPFPWYAEAPFVVEPVNAEGLYAYVPGTLTAIHKRPGDFVQAGDLIAELRNDDLEERRRQLAAEEVAQQREVDAFRSLDQPRDLMLAEQRLTSLRSRLAEAEKLASQCRITAPIDGRLVAAPRQEPPGIEQHREQLATWSGTPLDPANIGCFLEERALLGSIAPSGSFQALLLIDQGDRRDLAEGQAVRMKIEHLPGVTLDGVVESISSRSLAYAPPALSNKYGGPLPTVQEASGQEKLTSLAFQAAVPLDLPSESLRTGMRGQARVIVTHRSAWDWIWRWLRTTFRFRI